MTEQETPPVTPAPAERVRGRRWWVSPLVTLLSLVLAFLLGAVVMVLADPDVLATFSYFFSRPGDALAASWDKIATAYGALLQGSVGSWESLARTTAKAAPLICAGLGVAFAFRAGLFNIGAQGQAIVGAIVAAFLGFTLRLPMPVHLLVCIAGGLLAGALWGGIAGFLRARLGAHEVITTIMLNNIAVPLLGFLLTVPVFVAEGRSGGISPQVEWSATFPRHPDNELHLGFFLALLAAVVLWWVLERTTLGFQLKAVGHNPEAARTAGMPVGRIIMVAMAVAGALGGLAGAQQVMAPSKLTGYPPQLSPGVVESVGFDAITVALLGRSHPLGVVGAGLLFGALKAGGQTMAAQAQTPSDLTSLIQALIVLFVAAPAVVTWLVPWLKERRSGAGATAVAA